MATFNADQKKAIDARNNTILVSAAAGSGKTTVMVEKIRQTLLSDPTRHLSNMLVVTFTNEAASNMRRKLQDMLLTSSEDSSLTHEQRESMSRALEEIENAQISTIHSFCIQVIRSGFHLLDVDPQVRVGESVEITPLFENAFYDAVNELLDPSKENDPEASETFALVKELFGAFREDELLDDCRALYNALMGIPNPFDRLHEVIETISLPISEQPWAMEIVSAVKMDITTLMGKVNIEKRYALDLPDYPQIAEQAEKDEAVIRSLIQAVSETDDPEQLLNLISDAKKSMPKNSKPKDIEGEDFEIYNAFSVARNKIKDSKGILTDISKQLSSLSSVSQLRDNLKIQKELLGMEVLLRRVAHWFRVEKQNINVIDFSDMEQMTYQLMTDARHPEIRENLQKTYTDIYVDESQDISAVQYAILSSIHTDENHLFMVGDVKQSIYRFRHAEPRLFMHLRDTYSLEEEADCRKIYFQDNYRSAVNVIDCVNEVFSLAMDRNINELDYEKGDYLFANKEGNFGFTELILLDQNATEQKGAQAMLEAQCIAAAERINGLLSQEEDPQVDPPYQYKDIAILVRSVSGDAQKMLDIFKELHVPVFFDGAMNFYDLSEVRVFLSLLNVIDNMHQDVPLLATLRHAPFHLTESDFAEIASIRKGRAPFYQCFEYCVARGETELDLRCAQIDHRIHEWRLRANTMRASDFIWLLLRETGFYAICGAYPDGKLRQNNLDMLYQKALDMEKRGIYRLSDLLQQIQQAMDAGQRDSDSHMGTSDSDNCVRLMTMHKSKGLEFRTVILMNLSKNLLKKKEEHRIRIDVGQDEQNRPALGVYLPAVNLEKNTKRNTFGKTAFVRKQARNAIAEETRLMYVAMTRAMEKLVMIGSFKQKDLLLWKETDRKSRIWQTKTFLDMVMPAVLQKTDLPETGQSVEHDSWRLSVRVPKTLAYQEQKLSTADVSDAIQLLLEREDPSLREKWDREPEPRYPMKTSVSSMIRDMYDDEKRPQREEDLEENAEQKRMPETRIVPFLLDKVPEKPRFMEIREKTSTEKGVATHRFLRLLDFTKFRELEKAHYLDEVENQVDLLCAHGILSAEEKAMIDREGIARFLATDLAARMMNAPRIHREWPFHLLLDTTGGTVLQGIIDAAFTEGEHFILIDYKTDHDTRKEPFVDRHKEQMNWYRYAIEEITGMYVREMWLVALRTGETFEVPRIDVIPSVPQFERNTPWVDLKAVLADDEQADDHGFPEEKTEGSSGLSLIDRLLLLDSETKKSVETPTQSETQKERG